VRDDKSGTFAIEAQPEPSKLLESITVPETEVTGPPENPSEDTDGPKGVEYEDRVVAFVDILGFKEIVYGSQNNRNLLNQIYGALDIRNDDLARAFSLELGLDRSADWFDDKFHSFSDSIVMSVKMDITELGLLIFMVFHTCRQLLRAGFPSRGGIAMGPLLHRFPSVDSKNEEDRKASPMVFGPAFIDAYNLENTHADGARVIMQTKVWKMLDGYCSENEGTRLAKFFRTHVERAEDGPAFVNLFADFPGNAFYNTEVDISSEIQAIQKHLCKALDDTADKPHQFRKNLMLAHEFNFALETATAVPKYQHLERFLIPRESLPKRRS